MALVAAYSFDNTADLGADASTAGHDLTITGGTYTATGHSGGGLATTTSGGTVAPFDVDVDGFTIMGWFLTGTGGAWSSFIQWGDDASASQLYLEASPNVVVDCYANLDGWTGGVDVTIAGAVPLAAGWHHIAATVDATNVTLYIDGTATSLPSGGAVAGVNVGTWSIAGSADQAFSGTADDVRIYNEALTAAQITDCMNTDVATNPDPTQAAPTPTGTAAGSITWTAAATGSAPAPGVNSGTASDAIAWTAQATGSHTASGTATGGIQWAATAIGPKRFVVGVHPDGQSFVDQNGARIVLRGCSPWCLAENISVADAKTYLDQVSGMGFNTAIVQLVGTNTGSGGNADGATFDGVKPFDDYGDWSTGYNETYWARVDQIIDYAASVGVTIMLDYAFGGLGGQGALYDLAAQGTAASTAYGTFLGNRYKNKPNIMWMAGGDWASNTWSTTNPSAAAVIDAVKATGDTHMWTFHGEPFYLSDRNTTLMQGGRLDFNFAYTYAWAPGIMRDATDAMPLILGETEYLGENVDGGPDTTDATLRRQACWAYACGAAGDITGSDWWDLHAGWSGAMQQPVFQQINAVRDTIETIDWWTLKPDLGNTVLTAGQGTFPTSGTMSNGMVDPLDTTYAQAAAADDGSLALVYIPDATGTVTIDESKFGTTGRSAIWVDPTNGATSPATWGDTYSRGSATNAAGDTDWLLVLQADPISSTNSGTASGGLTWTAAATGQAPAVPEHDGTATGGIAWTGSAHGTAPTIGLHSGAASGSLSWIATADGWIDVTGTANGGIDWTARAAGTAPPVGVNTGTAAATIAWATAATGTAPAIPDHTGLLAAYAFDEGTGNTTADASGNSHAATVTDWTTPGHGSDAAAYSSTTTAAGPAATATLPAFAPPLTYAAWFKLDPYTGDRSSTFAATQKDVNEYASLYRYGDDNHLYFYADGATGTASASSEVTLSTGWRHIAYTIDAQTAAVYIDGVQAMTVDVSSVTWSGMTQVFAGGNKSALPGNGAVDDLRIYGRALTSAEVQSCMNTPVGVSADPTVRPARDITITGTTAPLTTWAGEAPTYAWATGEPGRPTRKTTDPTTAWATSNPER